MKSVLAEVEGLIEEQAVSWPKLAQGLRGLRESRTRSVMVGNYNVLVRHIPHRITSTTAPVDAASVARRPCFLCAANLPPEEHGVELSSEFIGYCNPYPILERHLTIVHRDHIPQAIGGRLRAMADIARSLPGFFLIYNGPECGASAPDHLHFQACSRAIFPIEQDTSGFSGLSFPHAVRRVFVVEDEDAGRLSDRLDRLIAVIASVTGKIPEPLLNLAMFHDGGRWKSFVFPRDKHRPRVYETGELTVSPATIDLCGIFVVPLSGDYERISGSDIEHIFAEVTLNAEAHKAVVGRIAEEHHS